MMELLYLGCSAAICLRLLLYCRTGARFKRGLSFIAWLLIASSGSLTLALLTGVITSAQLPAALGPLLVITCTLVFLAGGNISTMIRMTQCLTRLSTTSSIQKPHSAKATVAHK